MSERCFKCAAVLEHFNSEGVRAKRFIDGVLLTCGLRATVAVCRACWIYNLDSEKLYTGVDEYAISKTF